MDDEPLPAGEASAPAAPRITAADVFDPGAADDFFAFAREHRFVPNAWAGFHRGNALWLAEFCRLIYRRGADEVALPNDWRTRDEVLRAHGWREAHCLARDSSRAGFFVHDEMGVAVLAFRGTLDPADVVSDAQFLATCWRRHDAGRGHVHSGFKAALNRIWTEVEAVLRAATVPVVFTGHSLGGALAMLAAARAGRRDDLPRPAALYTFGAPRTGDAAFAAELAGLFHCRVVNERDLVPGVPAAFSLPLLPVYRHNGRLHRLRWDGRLETSDDGFDVPVAESALPAVRDLALHLGRLFARARGGGALPDNLLDHAPRSYVARLLRLAPS